MKKDNVGRGCKKKPVKKEWIEDIVRNTLTDFLDDTENLANLAVDLAEYYKKEYDDNGYLSGLENELKETEKSLENVIKAVMAGASGETINKQHYSAKLRTPEVKVFRGGFALVYEIGSR